MNKLLMCLNPETSKKLCPQLQQNGIEVSCTSDLGFALKLFDEGSFFLCLVEDDPKIKQAFSERINKSGKMAGILFSSEEKKEANEAIAHGFLSIFSFDQMDQLIKFILQIKRFSRHFLNKIDLIQNQTKSASDTPIFKSQVMLDIIKKVEKVAATQSSVLLTGESGTGKEVIARLIHEKSYRSQHPFVAINACAIARELLESELFGHEKGSFTGAIGKKIGRFEYAQSGTFFLDEISEIPIDIQAKLLRVLQEKEFERVGGLETIKINVRFIAASNQDLLLAIKEKRFREDLFYRLNVVPIHIPPLRERKEDLIPLALHFIEKHTKKNGYPIMRLKEDAITKLESYDFPGNVRELSNIIERATILCFGQEITASDLIFDHQERLKKTLDDEELNLELLEKKAILKALKVTGGNKTLAAKLLGLSVRTLRKKELV